METSSKTILILDDGVRFSSFLARYEELFAQEKGYIAWGDYDLRIIRELEDRGFHRISRMRPDENYKKNFLKAYVDLIGLLSEEFNSRLWWATDLSSKNRATSFLADYLEQLIQTIDSVEKTNAKLIVVLGASPMIRSTLIKELEKRGIANSFCGSSLRQWCKIHFYRCRKMAGVFYHSLRMYGVSVYARLYLNKKIKSITARQKPYYILKTFIYDHSFAQDNRYVDVFFGPLARYLADRKNLLILPLILGNFRNCLRKIKRNDEFTIIPIECFLMFKDVFAAIVRIGLCRFKINKTFNFLGYDVSDVIRKDLYASFNGIQARQYLHYNCARNLLKRVDTESFLMTYENNPWERMCTLAIREMSPSTKVFGFQHAIISEANLVYYFNEQEKNILPLPDLLFTVGRIPTEMMLKHGSYKENELVLTCALRNGSVHNRKKVRRQKRGHVLVVLGGSFNNYKLLSTVIDQLRDSVYQVMLRPHPLLPWRKYAQKYGFNLSKYSNFQLSRNVDLSMDLDWADIVIYWESTVCLEALAQGIPLIHYDNGSILSYDPISDCPALKKTAFDGDSLEQIIDSIYQWDEADYLNQQKRVDRYIHEYFHPVTEKSLAGFISEKREMAANSV